jgi:hypothetical protein
VRSWRPFFARFAVKSFSVVVGESAQQQQARGTEASRYFIAKRKGGPKSALWNVAIAFR